MVVKAGKKTKTGSYTAADPVHSPADILARAISLHQSGKLIEAEGLYRHILGLDPVNADALHLLGVIAYQAGKNDQALEYIGKAIEINPSVSFFHNNLGNVLMNIDRKDEAAKCFEKAVRLMPDNVEASNNLGNIFRDRGRKSAAIEQYRRTIEINPDYALAHNNLANLLKDSGKFDDAIIHYKKAIELMPGLAEIHLNYGSVLNELNQLNEAAEQYRKAIITAPDFAEAYNDLGNVLKKQKKYDEAVQHYKKAISLKPEFAKAYNNMADAYRETGMFKKAEELCFKALELDPGNARLYLTLGSIYLGKGSFNKAMEQYQKALDIDPDLDEAIYNTGLIQLLKGEFEEGWSKYERRFQCREVSKVIGYQDMQIPEWDGTLLNGRNILIKSEQGFGDHIQFVRYIPMVKSLGGNVMYECPKELRRLFEGYQGIDKLLDGTFKDNNGITPDVYIHLLSLPGIFNITAEKILADIPYLHVDPEAVNKWNSMIDRKTFNAGIIWSGNPDHRNDRNRSCRLSDLASLADVPGVTLYSLQKGGISEDELKTSDDMQIIDIGKDIEDFYDTAAIIESLDLIISVDTAVAHLAGALGKNVWTLIPLVPDWRWMIDREDTPWYPTMRLFRQKKYVDWQIVIKRVSEELKIIADLKGVANE